MGLSSQAILCMQWDEAKSALKQRIMDMERQADLNSCPNFRVPDTHKYRPLPMTYLSQLEIYKFRKSFTLARCEAFTSMVLEARFNSIPREQRLCPCGSDEIESIEHMMFRCSRHKKIRAKYITPLLKDMAGQSDSDYCNQLLLDYSWTTTKLVAKSRAACHSIDS
ncbi:hypothetical protein JRQ81_010586 [Phrynocephalus forsythii]|uniref:Uncharacterized protein n=1 Tax=Phrynocephalus forsythii TaxID=171643 RepID=A0A9Q0Y3F6_9SAUR|nr:hypothetical protein JRQ81_010586 [Phrynocephalus forsythii]